MQAVKCFNKSLEIEPNVASVWIHRGNAFDDSGKYEEAIASYCKALEIEIDPLFTAEIWNDLGICFYNLGAYEVARNSYDIAIELEHYDRYLKMNATGENRTLIEVHTWFLKGNLLHKLGKNYEAIECYDESLKINPTDADPWLNKGICYYNLEKYKEAKECYDKALKIDHNLARAWKAQSLALGKLGEYDDAIEIYNKAQRIDPASVIDWDIFNFQSEYPFWNKVSVSSGAKVSALLNKSSAASFSPAYERATPLLYIAIAESGAIDSILSYISVSAWRFFIFANTTALASIASVLFGWIERTLSNDCNEPA